MSFQILVLVFMVGFHLNLKASDVPIAVPRSANVEQSRNEYRVRFHHDINYNIEAQRHFLVIRGVQRIMDLYDKDPSLFRSPGTRIIPSREEVMRSEYAWLKKPGYMEGVISRGLRQIPIIDILIPENEISTGDANQFNEVLDRHFTENDPLYQELIQSSEAESLGYDENADHSEHIAVKVMHAQSQLQNNAEAMAAVRAQLSQANIQSREIVTNLQDIQARQQVEINSEAEIQRLKALEQVQIKKYEEIVGGMRVMSYVYSVLGHHEAARAATFMAAIYEKAVPLLTNSGNMSTLSAGMGWLSIAMIASEFFASDNSGPSSTEIILQAIQQLSKQINERFDRVEEMLQSLGYSLALIQRDQQYTIRLLGELLAQGQETQNLILRLSERSKLDSEFEKYDHCSNLLKLPLNYPNKEEELRKCLYFSINNVLIGMNSGSRSHLVTISGTDLFANTDMRGKTSEFVKAINESNIYGNLSLLAHIARTKFQDQTLSTERYPNLYVFEVFYELFLKIYESQGVASFDAPVYDNVKENYNQLETAFEHIRKSNFLVKYIGLLQEDLEVEKVKLMKDLILSTSYNYGVNLLSTDRETLFRIDKTLEENISELNREGFLAKVSGLIKEFQTQDVALLKIPRPVNISRYSDGPLYEPNKIMVDELKYGIAAWFPDITKYYNIEYVEQNFVTFNDLQLVRFKLLPKTQAPQNKAVDFVLRLPKLDYKTRREESENKQIIRQSVKESRTSNIQQIIMAVKGKRIDGLKSFEKIYKGELDSLSTEEQNSVKSFLQKGQNYLLSVDRLIQVYEKELLYCPAYPEFMQQTSFESIHSSWESSLLKVIEGCRKK